MFRFRGIAKVGPPSSPGCRAVAKYGALEGTVPLDETRSRTQTLDLYHWYIMMRGRVLRSDPSRSMPMLEWSLICRNASVGMLYLAEVTRLLDGLVRAKQLPLLYLDSPSMHLTRKPTPFVLRRNHPSNSGPRNRAAHSPGPGSLTSDNPVFITVHFSYA
jgi:hypothetical protein